MSKPGTKLGFAALVLGLGTALAWFRTNNTVGIPDDRTLFVVGFLLAVALGAGAFVRGTKWYGGIAALVGILVGILLPMTIYISPQQLGPNAILVGDTLPKFTAVDEFGKAFDSESLQGHLVLIKFFRAHW